MSKQADVSERRASVANDMEISEISPVERVTVRPKNSAPSAPDDSSAASSSLRHGGHGIVEVVGPDGPDPADQPALATTAVELEKSERKRFAYLRRPQFWIVLILSQCLAIANTGTSTITTLLDDAGNSVPAFQSLFNYILLNLIYTSYTIYKYGWRKWLRLIYKDGWRFFLLAFCDVEGNYFTVLAYRYTTILSADLINFWAIAVVVMVSLIFLKVRYHIFQYAGILICVAGLGVLLSSDEINGAGDGPAKNAVKGDLFALLGATFYGLDNVVEEYFLSKRPLYEVVGQMAFWGTIINGAQAGIFNRQSFREATWNAQVGGYFVGYTLLLTFFYSAAPLVFRMASAAFFNIGLLTGNFWGIIIGVKVFHYTIHWMYPIAFCLIMGGHFVYYGTEGVLGEAKKPWLGDNQEGGDDGVGTARRRLEHPNVTV